MLGAEMNYRPVLGQVESNNFHMIASVFSSCLLTVEDNPNRTPVVLGCLSRS